MDILLYGDQVAQFDGFEVPRQDVYRYAFVLTPLLDIAPNLTCPKTSQPLADFQDALKAQTLTPVSLNLADAI